MSADQRFITAKRWRTELGVSAMFLHRRLQDDPTFPPAFHFGSHIRFFRVADCRRWERDQMRKPAPKVAPQLQHGRRRKRRHKRGRR